jgi:twitching motility protein PilT
LVRENLGSWKKYRPIITVESWSNESERQSFLLQIKERNRFPRRELFQVLSDVGAISNRQKKHEILETIGELLLFANDSNVPENLIELLQTTHDPEIRIWVSKIFPQLASDDMIPAIIQFFRHPKRVYRQLAETLLSHYGVDKVADALAGELILGAWTNRSDPLRYLVDIAPDKASGACKQTLLIGNESDRLTALEILADSGRDEAVATLADSVDDDSEKVRSLLAERAGRIPGEASVRTLMKLALDKKAYIAEKALEGLKRLADESSLPAVIQCARHDNVTIRAAALATLGDIGTSDQLELLIQGIKDSDIHIRQAAENAVTRISQRVDIDRTNVISGLLQDEDVNVRRAAARIIGEIDTPKILDNIFVYMQDDDWWVRESVVKSLTRLKDPDVYPAAVELLRHSDPALRRYAIDILVNLENNQAVESLLMLLKDADWWVRERAAIALGKLGSKDVIPMLADLLAIPKLRPAAAEAMGNIGDQSAVQPLLNHLQDSNTESRLAILSALEKIKSFDSIPYIETCLNDSSRDVRIRTAEVLARLRIDPDTLNEMHQRWWKNGSLSILDTILVEARKQNASDVILTSACPPMAKLDGDLSEMSSETLTADQLFSMVYPLLSPIHEERFHKGLDLAFSHQIPSAGRFYCSVMQHLNGINLAFRLLPDTIPVLESLKLPDYIKTLADIRHGLILVSGPPASGKTTTISALINRINETRTDHIVTIEEPIEFIYKQRKSFIVQREIGRHTQSFSQALHAALRENADVIMVSDIPDTKALVMVLTAAAAGHLVIASITGFPVSNVIEKIINAFPVERQNHIQNLLSESLKAIVCQQLVPQAEADNPVAAAEILVNTDSVAGMIRNNKLFQITSVLSTGGRHGMISMDQSLVRLVKHGIVIHDDAYARAFDKHHFDSLMQEMMD